MVIGSDCYHVKSFPDILQLIRSPSSDTSVVRSMMMYIKDSLLIILTSFHNDVAKGRHSCFIFPLVQRFSF